MIVEMRHLMNVVTESGPGVRRTYPHKAFADVTNDELMRALIDIEDLRRFLEGGTWDDMDWGEDEEGDGLDGPEIPVSSAHLTPEQIQVMKIYCNQYRPIPEELVALAASHQIPICRRLNRLSDLTKPLGVHWSKGHDATDDTKHFGDIVVLGSVENKNVDWITTTARAMFLWREEHEITVAANAPLFLLSITFPSGTKGMA